MTTFSKINAVGRKANTKPYSKMKKEHGFLSQVFPWAHRPGSSSDNHPALHILRQLYHDMWYNDITSNWKLKKPHGGVLVPEMQANTASLSEISSSNIDQILFLLRLNQSLLFCILIEL
jgi:hypothetical protein